MDAFNDPEIDIVSWMSSVQVGKTEVVLNVVGYYAENDPSPMMVLQPTQKPMAETFSKDRISPMFRDTPCLKGMLSQKAKGTANTILHKAFPGGQLTIAGANSPASLASRPIRILLCDEVDRYPDSAGSEGDPLSLAERRTTTFWNRKILRVSTPTVYGMSRIEAAFLEGDQRYFEVPCPHCDQYQRLKWAQVTFEKLEDGSPDLDSVHYECRHCKTPIEEIEKRGMLTGGEWRASRPANGHASFHISALYSPWVKWRDIVKDWHESRGDHERMKVWTNTMLGETFREEAREVAHGPLMARPRFAGVPDEVLVVTAGVDVQEDRLEVLAMGWYSDEQSYPLEHRTIYGDTTLPQVWEDLRAWLANTKFQRSNGGVLTVAAAGVDSGYQTRMVYEFVARTRGRVFALKGVGGERAIVTAPTNGQRAPVWSVGSDAAKDVVLSRLAIKEGPGASHFADWCDEEFFLQLTAERAVLKKRRGFEYREYQLTRPRNEILDLYQYNLATLYILNPIWEALAPKSAPAEPAPEPTNSPLAALAKPRPRNPGSSGGFVDGWRRR